MPHILAFGWIGRPIPSFGLARDLSQGARSGTRGERRTLQRNLHPFFQGKFLPSLPCEPCFVWIALLSHPSIPSVRRPFVGFPPQVGRVLQFRGGVRNLPVPVFSGSFPLILLSSDFPITFGEQIDCSLSTLFPIGGWSPGLNLHIPFSHVHPRACSYTGIGRLSSPTFFHLIDFFSPK